MKKTLLLFLTLFLAVFYGHALPSVSPYLPDTSGEYIYYKDSSFKPEALVGFLYYDEGTYAIRFYSEPKDITLYITVNPKNPNLEFTGENITGATAQEDADIINYLHDLFYEFTSRRQKIILENNTEKKSVQQEFLQFGGNVKINFNNLAPIFNIESITELSGKEIFSLQTTGLLSSSLDDSFSSYKGVKGLPKDKSRKFKPEKKNTVRAEFDNQKISLDEQWTQSMTNLWLLQDYALISFSTISLPQEYQNQKGIDFFTRKLSQSTEHSYALWNFNVINNSKKKSLIMKVYFQPETNNVTREFKTVTLNNNGTISYMSLTIFDNVYQQNKKYFDKILDSYKVN